LLFSSLIIFFAYSRNRKRSAKVLANYKLPETKFAETHSMQIGNTMLEMGSYVEFIEIFIDVPRPLLLTNAAASDAAGLTPAERSSTALVSHSSANDFLVSDPYHIPIFPSMLIMLHVEINCSCGETSPSKDPHT
jgi:hypothetical protein